MLKECFMIIGFGPENKSQVMLLQFFYVWTVAAEGIFDNNDLQMRVFTPEVFEKPF